MASVSGRVSFNDARYSNNVFAAWQKYDNRKLADEETWNQYLNDVRKNAARKNQAKQLAIELGEDSFRWQGATAGGFGIISAQDRDRFNRQNGRGEYSPENLARRKARGLGEGRGRKGDRGGNAARTGQGGYGGDWGNGNDMFSFDSMKTMAKDLSQQQIDHNKQMMELSYGYRTKEKDLDSGIRQREANQQFGFQQKLQAQNETHLKQMQDDRFNQEQEMFGRQEREKINTINSARKAASNLYRGGYRY